MCWEFPRSIDIASQYAFWPGSTIYRDYLEGNGADDILTATTPPKNMTTRGPRSRVIPSADFEH